MIQTPRIHPACCSSRAGYPCNCTPEQLAIHAEKMGAFMAPACLGGDLCHGQNANEHVPACPLFVPIPGGSLGR